MGIVAKKTVSDYELPPQGTEQAVCAEVVDLGHHPNPFQSGKTQHKILILWQLEAVRKDGRRHLIGKRYTNSLDDRAILRHDLKSWRGRDFTPQEEAGFDLDHVLGANCVVNIEHKETKDGKTYANVMAVMPLLKGMPKMKVADYVRPEYVAKLIARADDDVPPPDDEHVGMLDADDIPF